jgi:hypothetical protein
VIGCHGVVEHTHSPNRLLPRASTESARLSRANFKRNCFDGSSRMTCRNVTRQKVAVPIAAFSKALFTTKNPLLRSHTLPLMRTCSVEARGTSLRPPRLFTYMGRTSRKGPRQHALPNRYGESRRARIMSCNQKLLPADKAPSLL